MNMSDASWSDFGPTRPEGSSEGVSPLLETDAAMPEPGAGEFGRGARSVRVETPDDILGGAGVQRPIAATKDIDKGHLCFHGTDTRTQRAHLASGSVTRCRWRATLVT